jgi:hypothetical protein
MKKRTKPKEASEKLEAYLIKLCKDERNTIQSCPAGQKQGLSV